MMRQNLLRIGWNEFERHWCPVLAAVVMYTGIQQILSEIRYPITGLILSGLNAVIRQGFRDSLPLTNYYAGVPWQYRAKIVAGDVIGLVLGMFIGLWANARNQRRTTP